MARGLVWSPEAVEDLESIASYIERDSVWYACRGYEDRRDIGNSIGYPELGRVVPEIGDATIRERFAYCYRIIYRVDQERVLMVALIHGRRMLESIVQRIESMQSPRGPAPG